MEMIKFLPNPTRLIGKVIGNGIETGIFQVDKEKDIRGNTGREIEIIVEMKEMSEIEGIEIEIVEEMTETEGIIVIDQGVDLLQGIDMIHLED